MPPHHERSDLRLETSLGWEALMPEGRQLGTRVELGAVSNPGRGVRVPVQSSRWLMAAVST